MKISLKSKERTRSVDLPTAGGRARFTIDGRESTANVAVIAPGLYSILLDGQSFETHVREDGDVVVTIGGREFVFQIEDPREWRRAGAALEAEGRQRVAASMPGKIVRVLVAAGQAVTAGQGLVVIEAMKMQNEVRAPKSGTVESLLVREGQAVNGGDVLAIVS